MAIIPESASRMPCRVSLAPHDAAIDCDLLLTQCDLRTQRRSGPGGQHRNKTSSGVFLTHRPSGLVGEATERRSQAQNREIALMRLRYVLALEIRTPSPLDSLRWQSNQIEDGLRRQYDRHSLRLSESNVDKPAVLALVLNDLWVTGGQPSLVAQQWAASTSKIVSLLRSYPPALTWVNGVRSHHERLPLH